MSRARKTRVIVSLDEILKSKKRNPLGSLFCGSNDDYRALEYKVFCDDYISLKPLPEYTHVIVLEKTETAHSGYCSDNDGTIYTSTTRENIYFKIPDGYILKECKSLFVPFETSLCYCGGNGKSYEVISISSSSS